MTTDKVNECLARGELLTTIGGTHYVWVCPNADVWTFDDDEFALLLYENQAASEDEWYSTPEDAVTAHAVAREIASEPKTLKDKVIVKVLDGLYAIVRYLDNSEPVASYDPAIHNLDDCKITPWPRNVAFEVAFKVYQFAACKLI